MTVDTPVRKSGVLIGRVTKVELEQDGGVLITAAIDAHRRKNVPQSDVPRIKGGLLGDAIVEFVPSGIANAPVTPVEDGAILPGVVVADPLAVISDLQGQLDTAVISFQTTSSEIGRLAQRASNLMEANEAQISRIVSKTESTIDTFKQVGDNANNLSQGSLGQLVNDPELYNNLNSAIRNVNQLTKEMKPIVNDVRVFTDKIARDPGWLGLSGVLDRKNNTRTKYSVEPSYSP